MKYLKFIIFIFLTGCSTNLQNMMTIAWNNNVSVISKDGFSSGVIIKRKDKDVFILTVAHALQKEHIGDNVSIVTETFWGQEFHSIKGKVIAKNNDSDLGLIKVINNAPSNTAVKLLSNSDWNNITPGLKVFAVGNPNNAMGMITEGFVSKIDRTTLITAQIFSGSSGGGVYDEKTGNLLGIIEGVRYVPQQEIFFISYIIKLPLIKIFLKKYLKTKLF